MRRGQLCPLLLLLVVGQASDAKVLGFHLDDESCSPDTRFYNRSTFEPACLKVLTEYSHWVGNLSGTGLVLSVDTGACVEATCENLTWHGVTKRAHEHVIDTVNESVVMDYVDMASGAVSFEGRGAAWLLSYAATFTPPRPVRF